MPLNQIVFYKFPTIDYLPWWRIIGIWDRTLSSRYFLLYSKSGWKCGGAKKRRRKSKKEFRFLRIFNNFLSDQSVFGEKTIKEKIWRFFQHLLWYYLVYIVVRKRKNPRQMTACDLILIFFLFFSYFRKAMFSSSFKSTIYVQEKYHW